MFYTNNFLFSWTKVEKDKNIPQHKRYCNHPQLSPVSLHVLRFNVITSVQSKHGTGAHRPLSHLCLQFIELKSCYASNLNSNRTLSIRNIDGDWNRKSVCPDESSRFDIKGEGWIWMLKRCRPHHHYAYGSINYHLNVTMTPINIYYGGVGECLCHRLFHTNLCRGLRMVYAIQIIRNRR